MQCFLMVYCEKAHVCTNKNLVICGIFHGIKLESIA